jgi:hypothetical protein
MKKLLIVAIAIVSTSLSTTLFASQTSEDQIALMELERDYMAMVNEPKRKTKATNNVDDDEPDCD